MTSSVSDAASSITAVDQEKDTAVTIKEPAQAPEHNSHDRIVQCSEGHYYTTIWVPGISLKALRFNDKRYQHCPVGKHWSMVQRVEIGQLSMEEMDKASKIHDKRVL